MLPNGEKVSVGDSRSSSTFHKSLKQFGSENKGSFIDGLFLVLLLFGVFLEIFFLSFFFLRKALYSVS